MPVSPSLIRLFPVPLTLPKDESEYRLVLVITPAHSTSRLAETPFFLVPAIAWNSWRLRDYVLRALTEPALSVFRVFVFGALSCGARLSCRAGATD